MPVLFLLSLCISLITFSPPALAHDVSLIERHAAQREVFMRLAKQLGNGEVLKVRSRRSELDGYPLAHYIDYLILKKEIELHAKPVDVLDKVARLAEHKRLHRRLLGNIKDRLVKLEQWSSYAKVATLNNTPVHPCDDLLASYKNGAALQFTERSADLWVKQANHTKSCDQAFELLLNSVPDVPTSSLWQRTVTLLKRRDVARVEELLKYFNRRDRKTVQAWSDGLDKPHKLLPSNAMQGTSVHHREMANFLLRRWARKDLIAATEFWRDKGTTFGFSAASVQDKVAEYAVLAAKRSMPEAPALLNKVTADRDVRYWRVRNALQDADWNLCLQKLDELTAKEQSQARWQYWRARCLAAAGASASAESIYREISNRFEFYGFLAADRIARDYSINLSQPVVSESHLQALRNSDAIARAIEFHLVGISWEGRSEWNAALKSSDKATYVAAAKIAEAVAWPDRALDAIRKAGESDALNTLFPVPHTSFVARMSERFSVAQPFIYGVMRQESRFVSDIKSPAGAVGLMQLMPATAKEMGDQLGIKAPRTRLIESELNIQLGVKYLNYVLGRFDDNIVLAAAAYNAGPTRVRRWTDNKSLPADIWIETIPYDETRNYVKRVLFNTVVSDWLLQDGKVTRLEQRMPKLNLR